MSSTTTLKLIAREMLLRMNSWQALGRLETPASYTTTTVVINALATGGRSADDFIGRYIVRRDASNAADRVRRITGYTASTGTLTHTGANYIGTTVGSEQVEIWQFEPSLIDDAIQLSLDRLRRMDVTVFPTVQGQQEYDLSPLTWVENAGDVARVEWLPNPIVTRDRYFESWGAVDTSGNLTPDWWTASATVPARSTTQLTGRRQYSMAVTRAGSNLTIKQSPGLLMNGTPQTNGEDLRNSVFTAVLMCWSSTASQVRVQWADGTQTVSSTYHTGNSTWQELTASGTIATTATKLDVQASIESSNNVCYLSECYGLAYSINIDQARRDDYIPTEIGKEWASQSPQSPILRLPSRPRGGQFRVYSRRGYPRFDSTRVAAGTADGDSTDAPKDVVATMAIARLFEGLAQNPGEDTNRYRALAADWGHRAQRLVLMHGAHNGMPKGGIPLPAPQFARPARRF